MRERSGLVWHVANRALDVGAPLQHFFLLVACELRRLLLHRFCHREGMILDVTCYDCGLILRLTSQIGYLIFQTLLGMRKVIRGTSSAHASWRSAQQAEEASPD